MDPNRQDPSPRRAATPAAAPRNATTAAVAAVIQGTRRSASRVLLGVVLLAGAAPSPSAQAGWVEIIGPSGDGAGHSLDQPDAITVGEDGTAYVAGSTSCNVFKIPPTAPIPEITQILGPEECGSGGRWLPDLAVDGVGNVYVALYYQHAVKRIASGGISTIIDSTGDGQHGLAHPVALALDAAGALYVSTAGSESTPSSVFKITHPESDSGKEVERVLGPDGVGGEEFGTGARLAVDGVGNVYATDQKHWKVFKIAPDGTIARVAPVNGEPPHDKLAGLSGIAAASDGTLYVGAQDGHRVFKLDVADSGALTVGATYLDDDETGRFLGEIAYSPTTGRTYVFDNFSVQGDEDGVPSHGRLFEIEPSGAIHQITLPASIDSDGTEPSPPDRLGGIAVDQDGRVYVTGGPRSNTAYKLTSEPTPSCTCDEKRAAAWGAYVACVETGVKGFYADFHFGYYAHFNGCRGTYFAAWQPPCVGDRFIADDETVTDRLTGLVWEKKQTSVGSGIDEANPHDVDNRYTWSRRPPDVAPPSETLPPFENGTAFTDFLAKLNGAGFAKASGWRLPTLAELMTLMDASGTGMHPEFPDPPQKPASMLWASSYWTSTSSPRFGDDPNDCSEASEVAWDVMFTPGEGMLPVAGGVSVDGKRDTRYVRAVRGGM